MNATQQPTSPPPALAAAIARAGQGHVLRFWERLDASGRAGLVRQLESIDWSGLPRLQALVAERRDGIAAAGDDLADAVTPPCVRLGEGGDRDTAERLGEQALAAGRIGAVLVAGGQGSRLGCEGPKGLYRVGPISDASLFELLLGGLLAVRRRHGRDVPLAIMTSAATDAGTRAFLAAHEYCGLDPRLVLVFQQAELPALEASSGDLLLDGPGRLATAPDGHGGMLVALRTCGGLEWFARHGVEHVATFQVDNPLALPLHAEFLGHHLRSAAEFTTQVIRKQEPGERVGVVVRRGDSHQVVEYSDLPPALAAARDADGGLRFHAGSIAVHAFALAFLERAAAEPTALPLHLAFKAVPFLDAAGDRIVPGRPNAFKFERFIFDIMPLARRICVVEIEAAAGFAPLKNPPGAAADAPEHVRAALVARARTLLARAGIDVAPGVTVELDAATVIDERDLAGAMPAGTRIDEPRLVRGGGSR